MRAARRSDFRCSAVGFQRMPESRDLLIEIGTEELPPKALKRLSDALAQGLREGIEGHKKLNREQHKIL